MLSRAAACAIALFSLAGCALSHERPFALDAGVTVDTATTDTGIVVEPDVGLPTRCTERWLSLPSCPADPRAVLGQRCEDEGAECGTACCEPSPAIACRGGVWVEIPSPDCSTVDCVGPRPCGTGFCGFGRVCLRSSGESVAADRCVLAPFELNACGEAPEGWLGETPLACESCDCSGADDHVVITLECRCCDS